MTNVEYPITNDECPEDVSDVSEDNPMEGKRYRWNRCPLPLALAGMAIMVFGLAACSRDPVAERDRHLQRAAGFMEKGKLDEAVVELRNALKVDEDRKSVV